MANTPTLNLSLKGTSPADLESSARDWRLGLNGLANSDMIKIDTHAKEMIETKFDDASYDKDNSNLILKANGQDKKTVKIETSNVLLDGEKEEKFDLEKAKIVQDGLKFNGVVKKGASYYFQLNNRPYSITLDLILNKTGWLLIGDTGVVENNWGLTISSTYSTISINKTTGPSILNTNIPIEIGKRYTITLQQEKDGEVTIYCNGFSTTFVDPLLKIQTNSLGIRAQDGWGDITAVQYDRMLTPQEANNNYNVLNNPPSIPDISITSKDGTVSKFELGRNDRVTLEDKVQDKFNFMRNQVEQDGLIYTANNISKSISTGKYEQDNESITFSCMHKTLGNSTNYLISNYRSTTGNRSGFVLGVSLQNEVKLWVNVDSDNVIIKTCKTKINIGTYNKITLIKTGSLFRVIINDIAEEFILPSVVKGVIPYYIGDMESTIRECDLKSILFYNHILTPQEISHNFSALNNLPSISALETTSTTGQKVKQLFHTNTDQVEDRAGRTQEEINRTFYKRNCVEKVADANGEIRVENGEEGYILSGSIEGNTVKNFLPTMPIITFQGDGTIWGARENPLSVVPIQPSTEYTMYTFVYENTLENDYIPLHQNVSVCLGGIGTIPKKQIGLFTTTATSISDFTGKTIACRSTFKTSTETGKISFQQVLIEGKPNDALKSYIPFGLSSTEATISNNGMKYRFYEPTIEGKTKVLKAPKGTQDWVEISPDETRDTTQFDYKLESLKPQGAEEEIEGLPELGSAQNISDAIDIASGKLVVDIKEIIFGGDENWTLTSSMDLTILFNTAVKEPSVNNGGIISNSFPSTSLGDTERVGLGINLVGVRVLKSKLPTPDVAGFKQYLAQQKANGTPVVARYQLATPIEIQLTEEQAKCYEPYKKQILLSKVGDVADSLEIKEDGSGLWNKKINYDKLFNVVSTWEKTSTVGTNTTRWYCGLVPSKLDGIVVMTSIPVSSDIINDDRICVGTYGNVAALHIRVPNSLTTSQQVTEYIKANYHDEYIAYKLATPNTTYIPKELCPTIATVDKINNLSTGETVRASSFKLFLPVTTPSTTYTLTPLNGWTNTGSTNPILQAIEFKDRIEIIGQISNTGTNQVLCNLPENVRPTKDLTIGTFTITTTGELRSSVNTGTLNVNLSYVKNLL